MSSSSAKRRGAGSQPVRQRRSASRPRVEGEEQPSLTKILVVFLLTALFAGAIAGLIALSQDGMVQQVANYMKSAKEAISAFLPSTQKEGEL